MAPSVLVFARTWSIDALGNDAMQALARCVRRLGAELVVLGPSGVWSLGPDDGVTGRRTDRLAGDVATAATLYQARGNQDAVFVLDDDEVVRVCCEASDLVTAVETAAACLVERRLRARDIAPHDGDGWMPAPPSPS